MRKTLIFMDDLTSIEVEPIDPNIIKRLKKDWYTYNLIQENTMLDLDKLSGETAKQILKNLYSQDVICSADVREAICNEPTAEVKRLTDIIHGVLCAKQHDDTNCPYYDEEANLYCWKQPQHKDWLEKTIVLMDELKISSEGEFTKVYGEAKRVQEILLQFKTNQPFAYKLLSKMNGWSNDT